MVMTVPLFVPGLARVSLPAVVMSIPCAVVMSIVDALCLRVMLMTVVRRLLLIRAAEEAEGAQADGENADFHGEFCSC
ncbi:MAG: hypothetical protein CMF76_00015 [Maricaulis sp.]|nr:hypothetical protein [Maricaulis sp.]